MSDLGLSDKQRFKLVVADRLTSLRYSYGYTQRFVGEQLGINPITLSGYEIGKSSPDLFTLARLANFYRVSLDLLLCLE